MSHTQAQLKKFVAESNAIEGITRPPRLKELDVTEHIFGLSVIKPDDIEQYVSVIQPGATLRIKTGMDVRVGDHLPPRGGPGIGYSFENVIKRANDSEDPFNVHCEYETLHPFMDGNGRSGRVLWAWQMLRIGGWGLKWAFLRAFYYQALQHSEARRQE
jgi:hypothetical protein